MFVDFNKVFNNKKPQARITIPPALISHLNKSLPTGVKYIAEDDGTCRIIGENGSLTVGGCIFEPTKEQKKILGENYTQEDVVEYFYNMQKPIPLKLKKDGYILLNGEEFPVDKIMYNPLKPPIKYICGSFVMYPSPFPKSSNLKIGCEQYERELLITRVPNNSVYVSAFESNKDDPLWVSFFIDRRDEKITFNVSFNLKNAKTISDIIESTTIYNAILQGKGTMLGKPLDSVDISKDSKLFDEGSIMFWEKVLEIEKCLDVHFKPPKEDIDFETVSLVEKLYQNLINKTPVRDNHTINSIDGKKEISTKTLDEVVGKPMYFEFEATSNMELFGVKKELPAIMGVFNAKLESYTQKGDKQKIIFADESSEKQRYTSVMYFKSEKDLKNFRNGNREQITAILRSAKKTKEYL